MTVRYSHYGIRPARTVVAARIGRKVLCSPATLSRWLSGESFPDRTAVLRFAQVCADPDPQTMQLLWERAAAGRAQPPAETTTMNQPPTSMPGDSPAALWCCAPVVRTKASTDGGPPTHRERPTTRACRSGDELQGSYAKEFTIHSMQQNCIPMMSVDDFPLLRGRAFAESFQARNDPFKRTHDIPPSRLEQALFHKENDLRCIFVGHSQITMDECQILARTQHGLAPAQTGERQAPPQCIVFHEIRQRSALSLLGAVPEGYRFAIWADDPTLTRSGIRV
ncbi:hypothetical protein EDD30_6516 [Couchioplanes caeruleus]|uniref:Uncharacterized protein n=1 Tax=Couchioplanes caeruleus TaxID=56438 RepID=A0A3N1GTK9_9ACTN|nr:hypothetical protein EDD30_6516 [Couchioplanes caeruleus]